MKISLFQGILFAVFGIGALIGLFVFATYSSKGGDAAGVGAVAIWGTLPQESMDAALRSATMIEQSLKSVTYQEKDEATLATELAAAIATGKAPDLILASQEQLLALSQFLTLIPNATLPPRTFQTSFVEGANIYATQGGYLGVPFLVDPIVLFTNRTILSSEGIAKPPATWEALTGLVPNVSVSTPSRQITRGLIALGTYQNVRNARGILSTLFLQTGVPLTGYSSAGLLVADLGSRTAAGVPPGQAVLRFYTQFADPSKVSYTWNPSLPDSRQEFLAGDLALYLGYASEASLLRQSNPNLAFEVAPVPQPATAKTKTAYGLVYAFMIPRGAANSAGAFQAAALLSNPGEQGAAANATGMAPASLTALSGENSDPIAAVAGAEALYVKGWLSPTPKDADQIFSSMIGNVTSGRTTIDTALSLAERSLSSLIQ